MTSSDDQLLDRAKWGQVSEDELARVAARLQSGHPEADRYTLLHILGKAGAKQYRALVEQFLQYHEDPMLARLALQILGGFWGETQRYLPTMLEFAGGVAWDNEDWVRSIAVSLLGEHARHYGDVRAVSTLLHVFEDETADIMMREEAYIALGRSMGKEWKDLPSAARHLNWESDIDEAVLSKARTAVAAGSGKD
jgi:hypothetical protein